MRNHKERQAKKYRRQHKVFETPHIVLVSLDNKRHLTSGEPAVSARIKNVLVVRENVL